MSHADHEELQHMDVEGVELQHKNVEGVGLMAFWPYADFPYVCYGIVQKIREDGRVYVPSYQAWWKPLLIVPEEAGKRLIRKLEAERVRRSRELAQVEAESEARLRKVAPELNFAENPEARGKTE